MIFLIMVISQKTKWRIDHQLTATSIHCLDYDLLIVVIIYVILRNGGCSMNCGVRVGGASRSAVEEA
jgi:hypothetical protein